MLAPGLVGVTQSPMPGHWAHRLLASTESSTVAHVRDQPRFKDGFLAPGSRAETGGASTSGPSALSFPVGR
jgi:hypothetical protein